MNWTVIWLPSAERDYLELWETEEFRDSLRIAVDEIERQLTSDPMDAGESRSQNQRILLIAPLAATFEVDEANRRVRVGGLWRTDRRRR